MEQIISVKHLRSAGLLGAEYTELDLYDAFLMYWILHNGADKDPVVLYDGNRTLDIRGYFKLFGDLVETPNVLRHHESLFQGVSVGDKENYTSP